MSRRRRHDQRKRQHRSSRHRHIPLRRPEEAGFAACNLAEKVHLANRPPLRCNSRRQGSLFSRPVPIPLRKPGNLRACKPLCRRNLRPSRLHTHARSRSVSRCRHNRRIHQIRCRSYPQNRRLHWYLSSIFQPHLVEDDADHRVGARNRSLNRPNLSNEPAATIHIDAIRQVHLHLRPRLNHHPFDGRLRVQRPLKPRPDPNHLRLTGSTPRSRTRLRQTCHRPPQQHRNTRTPYRSVKPHPSTNSHPHTYLASPKTLFEPESVRYATFVLAVPSMSVCVHHLSLESDLYTCDDTLTHFWDVSH
jgi:hypothetical protein